LSREKSWDERILEVIDPGIDETIIAENLRPVGAPSCEAT